MSDAFEITLTNQSVMPYSGTVEAQPVFETTFLVDGSGIYRQMNGEGQYYTVRMDHDLNPSHRHVKLRGLRDLKALWRQMVDILRWEWRNASEPQIETMSVTIPDCRYVPSEPRR